MILIGKIKKIAILLLATAFFGSCEKVEEQKNNSDKVVIEGYLIANQKISIKVSKEIAYKSDDTTEQPIEGLQILLSNDDQSETMIDNGSGEYTSSTLIAKADQNYSILLDYKGTTVSASTTIPEKPVDFTASAKSIYIEQFNSGSSEPPSFPEPISLEWSNPDLRYYLVVLKNTETNPTPIFDTTVYDLNKVFRNKPSRTDNYELNTRNFNYYGNHYVILFNLNPEYASLYEDNGSSSLNLTTPPSNINGGLGIFTGINSDTLTVIAYN